MVNWKIQMRKGYLELCILLLIQQQKKIYGFDLLEKLNEYQLNLSEGTLYPLLSRMTLDKTLSAVWETENVKGHPRKYYSLTKQGQNTLDDMKEEFEKLVKIFKAVQK